MAIRAYANGTKYTWLSTDTKPTKPTSADLGATLLKQIQRESSSLVVKLGNWRTKRPMSG